MFLGAFTWFFLKSRMGVAMRAVADNQQVAMAMGINVQRYFALAWAMAGIVSALGGVIWGSMLGVDTHLALVGLKVFPVVILGGLDSIVGAVIGGLIVGVVESIAAGYLDPYRRRRHQGFRAICADDRHADVQALRHVRPAQNRARVGAGPCSIARPASSRPPMRRTWRCIRCRSRAGRWPRWPCCSRSFCHCLLHDYYLSIINLVLIAIVGALGLNILVGYTGQISVGHAAFMSVGAYTAANLAVRLDLPFWITLPAGGLMAALIGAIVGIPSLRIKGLYLAIATLAGQLIIEWTINHVPAISGGAQASIEVPRPTLFGTELKTQGQLYFFLLFFAALAIVATLNLVRSRIGRAFVAIRDQDIAAEIIGINIYRYKLLSFAISSFYAGVCGVLYTYYLGIANYEQFQIVVSIDYLAMIIIGGLGSVLGSILGAAFVTMLPIVIRWIVEGFGSYFFTASELAGVSSSARLIVFGSLIIFFLVVEPEGLNRLWRNIRNYFRVWPFSY